MLNSVGATGRVRMTPEDRRRQLVGIGLRKFVERPVQELSLDEVAAEAGVSRGLLFHYFPTKTDYHRAVVEAAPRRARRALHARPRPARGHEPRRDLTGLGGAGPGSVWGRGGRVRAIWRTCAHWSPEVWSAP